MKRSAFVAIAVDRHGVATTCPHPLLRLPTPEITNAVSPSSCEAIQDT
jgi:hypothetical protein